MTPRQTDFKHMLQFLAAKTSPYELEKRLGISKSAIYYYLSGQRAVESDNIYEAVLFEYYRLKTDKRRRNKMHTALIKLAREFG